MQPRLLTFSTLASVIALSGCSMPGDSSNNASSIPTSLKINNHTVPIPAGYSYLGHATKNGTSVTEIMDKQGLPMTITDATDENNFSMSDWCAKMAKTVRENYAPGAHITTTLTPQNASAKTECEITGHGSTKGGEKAPPQDSKKTSSGASSAVPTPGSTDSTSSSATSSSSTSSTSTGVMRTIKPGSPYSILIDIKKAPSGHYVAMLARHLDRNSSFTVEKQFFNSVTK